MKHYETIGAVRNAWIKGELPSITMESLILALTGEEQEVSIYSLQEYAHDTKLADIIGGDFFLCEEKKDLEQVTFCDFTFAKEHDRWPNILEEVGWWDDCSKHGHFLRVFQATNNSGGPTYFIPEYLWQFFDVEANLEKL